MVAPSSARRGFPSTVKSTVFCFISLSLLLMNRNRLGRAHIHAGTALGTEFRFDMVGFLLFSFDGSGGAGFSASPASRAGIPRYGVAHQRVTYAGSTPLTNHMVFKFLPEVFHGREDGVGGGFP